MSDAQVTAIFVLVFTLFGCLLIAWVQRSSSRRRWLITAFDDRRCERCGSQSEWNRRLNGRTGR